MNENRNECSNNDNALPVEKPRLYVLNKVPWIKKIDQTLFEVSLTIIVVEIINFYFIYYIL